MWQAEAASNKIKTLWTDLRPGELSNAVVYGSYTAVQYADAVMSHRLAESLPHLMSGFSKQCVSIFNVEPKISGLIALI